MSLFCPEVGESATTAPCVCVSTGAVGDDCDVGVADAGADDEVDDVVAVAPSWVPAELVSRVDELEEPSSAVLLGETWLVAELCRD